MDYLKLSDIDRSSHIRLLAQLPLVVKRFGSDGTMRKRMMFRIRDMADGQEKVMEVPMSLAAQIQNEVLRCEYVRGKETMDAIAAGVVFEIRKSGKGLDLKYDLKFDGYEEKQRGIKRTFLDLGNSEFNDE